MSDKQRQTSRYLTEYFVEQALKCGKGIGQFLGWFEHNDQQTIRYLLIYPGHQDFELWVGESYDQGTSASYGDIGEYQSIHDDDEVQHSFATLEETLEFATSVYGASRERWVNESMINDEYGEAFLIRQKQGL